MRLQSFTERVEAKKKLPFFKSFEQSIVQLLRGARRKVQ